MTTAVGEVVRRRPGRPKDESVSMPTALRDALLAMLSEATSIRFPSPRYQRDPVAFCREILGIEPWSKQVEILEAVRDHDRVACKSGRRVSKSHTAAALALWWYCSYPDARVVMSSTTDRQVNEILWREVSMLRARAGRCVKCKAEMQRLEDGGLSPVLAQVRIPRPCPHSAIISGDIGALARTGLKSDDFRQIWGFTAREAEAVQGIAGARMLFILDEASGIPQPIFDAIEGNRAGGAKVLLLGNPTQNKGEFFDAFHEKNAAKKGRGGVGYHCITVSSEDSPNVKPGRDVIPGLATASYIREREIEWGRESAMFKIHVLGEFALAEEGRIFSVHAIAQAEQRWLPMPSAGRLFVGLDPAGPTGSGDETVFAVRRGLKVIEVVSHRGLTDEAHLVHLLSLLNKHRLPRETPVVVLDREGNVGASVYGLLRLHTETKPGAFELVGLRASDRAARQPQIYDRMRDELAANLEAWMRDGGAIPEDTKLAAELHELEWRQHTNGRLKVTPKENLRKILGRSPDRYDAIALAAWEPLSLREEAGERTQAESRATEGEDAYVPILDPYAGAAAWGGR